MNIGNALGFCVLGLVMALLSTYVPDLFPPDKYGTVGGSGMWMNFMGCLNASLGGIFLMREVVVPQILRLMAWRPASPREMLTNELLRPALNIYSKLESADGLQEERAA